MAGLGLGTICSHIEANCCKYYKNKSAAHRVKLYPQCVV